MSIRVDSRDPIPHYSGKELHKLTKKSPYVDNFYLPKIGKKPKAPLPKSNLPPFFERLIDQKVHQVAIMVIFHIVHFFCHMFWEDYRVEFDRKEAIETKKQKKIENLKQDVEALDEKIQKIVEKKAPRSPVTT